MRILRSTLPFYRQHANCLRTIADFDEMKIAVTFETTGEAEIIAKNPNAIPGLYDNEKLAIAHRLAGKVHALAFGDVSNQWHARQHPKLFVIDVHPIDPHEDFVIAVTKDRVAMGQKLDRFLREMRKSRRMEEMFGEFVAE